GAPELIAEVLKARGPYKVSSISERAAIATLESERAWVGERIDEVVINRSRLRAQLETRGIDAFESAANFVLVLANDCVALAAPSAPTCWSCRASEHSARRRGRWRARVPLSHLRSRTACPASAFASACSFSSTSARKGRVRASASSRGTSPGSAPRRRRTWG